jgi:L-rhamnose-H+ transport protein
MWNWAGVVIAGMLNGSFAFPLKTARTWKFDHIWMAHSLLAMAALPWTIVFIAVPRWSEILGALSRQPRGWLGLVGWGLLFGIGSLLYGVAVDLLGIALGFAIQLGLSIVLGALLPLFWARAFSLHSRADWLFVLGLAMMVAGVVLCAQAGGKKSGSVASRLPQAGRDGACPRPGRDRFRTGVVIAIIGGILAPTLNFGIQYGTTLLAKLGEMPGRGAFPLPIYLAWAVFLSAAAVIQAGYCFARVLRGGQVSAFCAPGAARDAPQVAVMSSLWIASVFIYGRSAFGLGRLGISFGWPIFVALIILTSNAWGVILGEWRGASRSTFHRMLAGSAVLIVAAFVIGQSKA